MSIKKGYFGNQPILNIERVELLEKNTTFKQEIKRIRKLYLIPALNPDKDIFTYPFRDTVLDDSLWLMSQPKHIQDKIINEIELLVKEYNLAVNFRDWIEAYILYGKPKYQPLFNYELVREIINNPEELQRLPLNTQEKNVVKDYVRYKLGINRRPPKRLAKAYKKLCQALSKSKSTVRRNKTLKTAIKTLEMGKKHTYFDYSLGSSGKDITYKTTSADLATNIFNDETGKKASLVRKQRQRLKERMKKLMANK